MRVPKSIDLVELFGVIERFLTVIPMTPIFWGECCSTQTVVDSSGATQHAHCVTLHESYSVYEYYTPN
jgi:hypothetical protein